MKKITLIFSLFLLPSCFFNQTKHEANDIHNHLPYGAEFILSENELSEHKRRALKGEVESVRKLTFHYTFGMHDSQNSLLWRQKLKELE